MPARNGASACAMATNRDRSAAMRCPVAFPEMPGMAYLLPVMPDPVMASTWCRPITTVPDMAATFPEPGATYPDISGTGRDAYDFGIWGRRRSLHHDHARCIGRLGIHRLNHGYRLNYRHGLRVVIRARCHDTACHDSSSGQGCQAKGNCFHFYNSSLIDAW